MDSRKIWGIILAIVLLLGGTIAYVILLRDMPNPHTITPQSETTNPPATDLPAAKGEYMPYSAEALNHAGGRKVLFFHAAWCPQCRALEKDIESQGVPVGMTIFKVDFDTAADLKQKYGVTLQTTVVEVNSEGELLKKHVAYDSPTLQAVLEALTQ